MKTLDEVIKAFEQCKGDKCFECAYHEKVHANSCIAKRDSDALIYLNAYQWQMTNPDGDHQQLEKCRALLSDFYRNDPLSWEELRTMEGKPVWVETKTKGGRWMILSYFGDVYKSDDTVMFASGYNGGTSTCYKKNMGITWQAYRKERNDN